MKIAENTKPFFKFSFFFVLVFLFAGTQIIFAQASKANISFDEFTIKSGNVGWQEGATVGNLKFNDVNGKKFNLYDLLDKPLLIEFWSVKSAQAKKNKAILKSFYKRFNMNILGICPDDYPNQIRKIGQQEQLLWSNVLDDSKKYRDQTFAKSQNIAQAKYVLINPDKTIHKIYYSEREIGKLGVELQSYFKQ